MNVLKRLLGRVSEACFRTAGLLLASLVWVGCSSAPKAVSDSAALDPAAAAEQAVLVYRGGDYPRADSLLRGLAATHPTSKHPWLKLAQIQFDERRYSEAIASAQEALQRDAADQSALSICAVSGLRVAAQSLQHLRRANSSVSAAVSTRGEAEALAATIREALGESVLVPAPGAGVRSQSAAVSGAGSTSSGPSTQGPSVRRRPARRDASLPAAPSASSPRPAAAIQSAPPSGDAGRPTSKSPASRGGNPFTILQ